MSFQLRLAAFTAITMAASTSLASENPSMGTTSSNQELTVEITKCEGDELQFIVDACADLGDAQQINVVYIVDCSGSMVNPNPAAGGTPFGNLLPPATIGPEDDLNGDGLEGTTLDAAILGVISLNRSFLTFPNVRVGMVAFGTGAVSADMSPFPGLTDFITPPNLNDSGNSLPDVEDVARSLQTELFPAPGSAGFELFTDNTSDTFSYATNYDAAIDQANLILALLPPDELNIVYFLTDGTPTIFTTGPGSPLQDAVDAGNKINCFGVGSAAVAANLCGPGQPLDIISSSTGGFCEEVSDPGDLGDALVVGPTTIETLTIEVNGNPVFTVLGPADDQLCTGEVDIKAFLNPGPGNVIEVVATAGDGTMVTACCSANVTACFLMLGFERVDDLVGPGDTMLMTPLFQWSVTQETCPDVTIPYDAALVGLHLYLQVLMYNEVVFPSDPLQLSNGVDVMIGGSWMPYGSDKDIKLWLSQSTPLGGVIDPGFQIQYP